MTSKAIRRARAKQMASRKLIRPTAESTDAETRIALPFSNAMRANRCAAQHFGAWGIEPKWFKAALNAIRGGQWEPRADVYEEDDTDDDAPAYELVDGVATIYIDGQMTKRGSSFGGCSTVEVRQQLKDAAADWMVRAILLHICSPGGTVAGTADLAADIRAAAEKKPVYAFIADMGCSAAYWAASQCRTIWANVTAMVGCIGTYTVLEDDTGWQEQMGIKWRVVSTGEFKGLGADGNVSDKLVADVQREVNELNAPFLADVAVGRKGKIADVVMIADGRAHVGEQARQLGLIDEVSTLDAAMAAIQKEISTMPITKEQFNAYAAENPAAAEVVALVNQGYEKAKIELKPKAATAVELSEAFPGDPGFAMEQLKISATLADAAVAGCKHQQAQIAKLGESHAKAIKDKDEAHAAAILKKDAEIEKARFESDGQRAVVVAGAGSQQKPEGSTQANAEIEKIEDPKERAKAEWKANTGECTKHFVSEAAYVGFRSAELRGGVNTHEKR